MTPGLDAQRSATTAVVPPLPAQEPAPSLVAGRYRLVQHLGSGGSADVWRAHDRELDRDVAIKLLRTDRVPDSARRARFLAEARATAGLSHPGIVTVHDLQITGDAAALVMAYVDGETLAARLTRVGRLALPEAASLAADVAEALGFAHARGLVHCDVKPGNILIGGDGRARLVDFGIARALLQADAQGDGRAVMGTLRYMAPEQLAGAAVGPATDVFALGAVLHEMLAGSPPFTATTPAGLVTQHRAGAPQLRGVPPGLVALVAACLAIDPSLRPSSIAAVARFLRGHAADPARLPGPRNARRTPGRARTAAVSAVVLVLLGAGALLAASVGPSTSNATTPSHGATAPAHDAAAASHRPRSTSKPKGTARPVVIVPASRVAAPPPGRGRGRGRNSGGDGGDGG